MVDMVPVKSTNIAEIGYDEGDRELHVLFSSGATYVYEGVGRTAYEDMLNADSAGSYLNRWIKGNHSFRRV